MLGDTRRILAASVSQRTTILRYAKPITIASFVLTMVSTALVFKVQTDFNTGESLPKARDALPSIEENLEHSRNILLAGTSIVSGEGRAVVFATGNYTEFGKIANLTQTAVKNISPLQLEIMRMSRIIAILAMTLGIVFFLIDHNMGLSFWGNFIFAIGIIVANVPEGLLPTVTLSLAIATQRMAK